MSEVLIVLPTRLGRAERDAVLQRVRPTQWGSDRVLLAEASPDSLAALRAVVSVVEPGAVPDVSGLSDAEALFANAWGERHRTRKVRRGEGQQWDALGFEPPG